MLSRNPEDSHTHANAGWNALQKGDRKQAETHFLEALRLNAENEYARHGLIETFRARSPIYRAYLSYCFFMQRFTGAQQWAMVIGLLVVMNFSNKVFKGPYEIIGIGVTFLYMLFVLWVHVARPVGNFLLAIDRRARRALRSSELREGLIVGGGVMLGLVMFLAGLASGWKPWFVAGFSLLGAAFPFAYTFTNESRFGKWIFGALGVFVLVAGLVNLADLLAPELKLEALAGSLLTLAIFVVVGTTWLSNVPALRR
jgi:F0F1-type ATP synthase assembly protein I